VSYLIQYRRLFTLQWLHEYYLSRESSLFQGIQADRLSRIFDKQLKDYRVSNDVEILPTRDCLNTLKNQHLIFKQDNFGFFVACKVSPISNNSFKPFVDLDEPISLRFAVNLKNPYVFNFSNTRMEKDIKNKDHFLYYFSNRANNLSGINVPYLTKPVPDFNPQYSYKAGEIFIRTAGNGNKLMFEAKEDNGPGTFKNSNWFQILKDFDPLPQFVTNLDRIVLRPKIFKHKVKSANKEKLTFLILDYDGALQKTLNFETSKAGVKLSECELDLSKLPSAYYSMQVQDETGTPIKELSLTFFMDNELFVQRPFALIECFHQPDGGLNEYKWLDQQNNDKLLSPNYTIHWKNRSTFWRYYYASAPSFASTQVKVYEHTVGNPINNILVSNEPFGLTQFGRRVEMDIDNETSFLPNPDVVSIFPENGKIYSEINMGGGLGPPV
jgi:hypothetical protein